MPATQNARSWRRFAASLVVVLAIAAVLFFTVPELRGMVILAVYTIPSHMFVSPFPHEPMLLYYAKSYPASACAAASIIGALIAGLWDYWLFVPLVHHPRVRSKYVEMGLYRASVRLFRKSPFGAIVLLGFTPLPFYPVKFLSLSDGYPLRRYLAALLVGRFPRYYLIAYLGYVLNLPNWLIGALALTLLVIGIFQSRRGGSGNHSANRRAI